MFLLESKNEFEREICNLLRPILISHMSDIYKDTNEKNKIHKLILKEFQIAIGKDVRENKDNIFDRVLEKDESVIKSVIRLVHSLFIIKQKILMVMSSKAPKVKIQWTDEIARDFIKDCVLEFSREIWKRPYLFYHRNTKTDQERFDRKLKNIAKMSVEEICHRLVKNQIKEYVLDDVKNINIGNDYTEVEYMNNDTDFDESDEDEDEGEDENEDDEESESDEEDEEQNESMETEFEEIETEFEESDEEEDEDDSGNDEDCDTVLEEEENCDKDDSVKDEDEIDEKDEDEVDEEKQDEIVVNDNENVPEDFVEDTIKELSEDDFKSVNEDVVEDIRNLTDYVKPQHEKDDKESITESKEAHYTPSADTGISLTHDVLPIEKADEHFIIDDKHVPDDETLQNDEHKPEDIRKNWVAGVTTTLSSEKVQEKETVVVETQSGEKEVSIMESVFEPEEIKTINIDTNKSVSKIVLGSDDVAVETTTDEENTNEKNESTQEDDEEKKENEEDDKKVITIDNEFF